MHLSRAVEAWSHSSPSGSSCAIRIKRGTSGDEDHSTSNIEKGGPSMFAPLLISTYGTGTTRPHITYSHVQQYGINRPGGSQYSPANFIYINGLHLQQTYTGNHDETVGINENGDDNHFVITDCEIDGFAKNISCVPLAGTSYSQWWSVFRNIIVDSVGESDHTAGIFSGGCRQGLVISQNVIDHNGWHTASGVPYRDTFSHNIYIGGDGTGPLIWGNLITNGGAYGVKDLAGGVIYGNLFAQNVLGCQISGDASEGGGRIARNYFEHGETLSSSDHLTWGPHVGGEDHGGEPFGPAIIEFNCQTAPNGSDPLGPAVFPDFPHYIQNGDFTGNSGGGGFDSWTLTGDTSHCTIITSDYHSDPPAAKFDSTASGGSGVDQTAGDINASVPVHVEFWIKHVGSGTGTATATLGSASLLASHRPEPWPGHSSPTTRPRPRTTQPSR